MIQPVDLQALEAQYGSLTTPKPKIGGLRGAALNFLPTIGGAAGAVIGTAAAPVVGTAAGGAVGSGLGEYIRQKIVGEETNLGTIGREAAFGALPGAARVVGKLRGAKGAIQATEQSTEAAMQAKGVVGKTKEAARNASQEGMGLTVGQSAGRGKVMTPKVADEQYDFMTNRAQQYGGIRPGKPIDQARDAQNVFNNVTKSLDETLTKVNRPLQPQEASSVVTNALTKIADSPAVTGTTKTVDKFRTKIEKAKDLKELEAIRREADDLAFTSTGAGKTSAAAQAHAVRDAIDDLITPLSPEYKAIKGDYTLARDALESTSKANKNAKGFTMPFTGTEIGKQTVSGVKNKVTSKVAGSGAPPPTDAPTISRPFMGQVARATVPQASTRVAGSAVFGTPFVGNSQSAEEPVTPVPAQPVSAMQEPNLQQSSSIFGDPTKVEEAYAKALMAGDTQTAAAILKGFEMFGGQGGKQKPLSAEASKVIANANSGLQSLQQLEGIMQEDPSVRTKTVLPGRSMFGGAGANALGTSSYDTAARNIADVITRLRTGAALTESEEAFYKSQLPQAFDPPETVQQKMNMFRDLFNSVASRTGTTGTDMQAAAGAQ